MYILFNLCLLTLINTPYYSFTFNECRDLKPSLIKFEAMVSNLN